MVTEALEDKHLYEEYRRFRETERLPAAVRGCAIILGLLSTFIFIPADWILFPDHFWSIFLPARIALDVLMLVVILWSAERFPLASLVVGNSAAACVFLLMVNQTGGVESGYYAGLILLALGLGVLAPLSSVQGLLIGGTLFVGYSTLPLYAQSPMVWGAYSQNLFFLGAAVLEGAFACGYVDRLHFADFKQRRELEVARDELRELDQAKSRFSANIHHELRTPLTLILAPLDALRSGDFGALPDDVKRTHETMFANGRRLLKMINNLLDLAKAESRQFAMQRRPMRIGEMIGELVDGAQALADRKRVALTIRGFDDLPVINADRELLEKVVVNLLGNALKFTEPGDAIEIVGENAVAGVRVSVRDTGVGFPDEKLDSIFDRFAQVDSSATRRHEGTGIGLSLARELVELHDGRIWAESGGVGQGSRLIFELPIGDPDPKGEEEVLVDAQGDVVSLDASLTSVEPGLDAPEFVSASAAISENGDRWERRRSDREAPGVGDAVANPGDGPEVVIAEDNPDMRGLLAFLLGREFNVRVARNGLEALESVREHEPALVLSDVMMPEMSGIDLCREIKQDPTLRGLPVMLVTSKAESEMQIEGLEQGADDYVTKPFHPRELMARVRSLVARRELQRELAEQNVKLEQTMRDLRQAEVRLVQAERLSAVGELAAGVAHEINNPINFAVNAARAIGAPLGELLDRVGSDASRDPGGPGAESLDELREAIRELMGIVTDGLDRTHDIVAKLRDFAAPGRGPHALVDVQSGIESTLELLRHFLGELSVKVEVEMPEGLPRIHGDAGALNQVYLNLIKNAAEAMDGREGVIHIAVLVEGEIMRIRVRDEGPGIDPEAERVLFDPFFTTKEVGKGTGLGLSISRQIAESHGGSLEVESSSERGATFVLSLPLDREKEARADAS